MNIKSDISILSILMLLAPLTLHAQTLDPQSQIVLDLLKTKHQTDIIPSYLNYSSQSGLNTLVKKVNVAKIAGVVERHTKSPYVQAASDAFKYVLKDYYTPNPKNKNPLDNIKWTCQKNSYDPITKNNDLSFPVALTDHVTWNRYKCQFSLKGRTYPSQNQFYLINQIDFTGSLSNLRPAVAFQNMPKSYNGIGRYVQPLSYMLRNSDSTDGRTSQALIGVNGGYDYRVDSWKNHLPKDNICYARYSRLLDLNDVKGGTPFYVHPTPQLCPMGSNKMPHCKNFSDSNVYGNMGDSLVYLSTLDANTHPRLQSYNCGQVRTSSFKGYPRGAFLTCDTDTDTNTAVFKRTPASSTAPTCRNSEKLSTALGAGPLLISNDDDTRDSYLTYKDPISEEGMPIDNYEIGGATGIAQTNDNGTITYHLVTVDGDDNAVGMNNWLLGLYFLHTPIYHNGTITYQKASNALALGNGGDSTMWINPNWVNSPNFNKISDQHTKDFLTTTLNKSATGVVSNCTYTKAAPQCGERPVHDGLFIYKASTPGKPVKVSAKSAKH